LQWAANELSRWQVSGWLFSTSQKTPQGKKRQKCVFVYIRVTDTLRPRRGPFECNKITYQFNPTTTITSTGNTILASIWQQRIWIDLGIDCVLIFQTNNRDICYWEHGRNRIICVYSDIIWEFTFNYVLGFWASNLYDGCIDILH